MTASDGERKKKPPVESTIRANGRYVMHCTRRAPPITYRLSVRQPSVNIRTTARRRPSPVPPRSADLDRCPPSASRPIPLAARSSLLASTACSSQPAPPASDGTISRCPRSVLSTRSECPPHRRSCSLCSISYAQTYLDRTLARSLQQYDVTYRHECSPVARGTNRQKREFSPSLGRKTPITSLCVHTRTTARYWI